MIRSIKWWAIGCGIYLLLFFGFLNFLLDPLTAEFIYVQNSDYLLMIFVMIISTLPILFYKYWRSVSLVSSLLLIILFVFGSSDEIKMLLTFYPVLYFGFPLLLTPTWLILFLMKFMSKKNKIVNSQANIAKGYGVQKKSKFIIVLLLVILSLAAIYYVFNLLSFFINP